MVEVERTRLLVDAAGTLFFPRWGDGVFPRLLGDRVGMGSMLRTSISSSSLA